MRAVALNVLKDKLSEYVRLAAGGETVLISDHDRVVAELTPPNRGLGALAADALTEAVRNGWLSPPLIGPEAPLPPRKPVAPLNSLMNEVAADRADR